MSDRKLETLSLRERMATWLRGKDPNEDYYWSDANNCACAQFAKDIGRFDDWQVRDMTILSDWEKLNIAARSEPHTFGALLGRLLDA